MQAFVKFSVDKSEMPHVAPTLRPSQGPKARPLATRAFALSDGWLCQLPSLRHTALRPVATGVPACLT
ncbi:hypothetical protein BVU99_17270 [Serratia sp. OLAL2]|nr:hypothetical protein BVU99_17270 [Serratia sp. OLAL2]